MSNVNRIPLIPPRLLRRPDPEGFPFPTEDAEDVGRPLFEEVAPTTTAACRLTTSRNSGSRSTCDKAAVKDSSSYIAPKGEAEEGEKAAGNGLGVAREDKLVCADQGRAMAEGFGAEDLAVGKGTGRGIGGGGAPEEEEEVMVAAAVAGRLGRTAAADDVRERTFGPNHRINSRFRRAEVGRGDVANCGGDLFTPAVGNTPRRESPRETGRLDEEEVEEEDDEDDLIKMAAEEPLTASLARGTQSVAKCSPVDMTCARHRREQ